MQAPTHHYQPDRRSQGIVILWITCLWPLLHKGFGPFRECETPAPKHPQGYPKSPPISPESTTYPQRDCGKGVDGGGEPVDSVEKLLGLWTILWNTCPSLWITHVTMVIGPLLGHVVHRETVTIRPFVPRSLCVCVQTWGQVGLWTRLWAKWARCAHGHTSCPQGCGQGCGQVCGQVGLCTTFARLSTVVHRLSPDLRLSTGGLWVCG